MSTSVYTISKKTLYIVLDGKSVCAYPYAYVWNMSSVSDGYIERFSAPEATTGAQYGVLLFDDEPSPVFTDINSGVWKDSSDNYPGRTIGFIVRGGDDLLVVEKTEWEISDGGNHVLSYNEEGERVPKDKSIVTFTYPIRYRTRYAVVDGMGVRETTYVDDNDAIHVSMTSVMDKYNDRSAHDLADRLVEYRQKIIDNRICNLENFISEDEEMITDAKVRIKICKNELKKIEALNNKE